VALNENYAEAHWAFGSVLPTVGLLAEAVAELRKALVLDPLYPAYSRWLGRFMLFAGDYSGAIAQSRKTMDLNSDYALLVPRHRLGVPGAWGRRSRLAVVSTGQGLDTSVRSYDALIVRALAPLPGARKPMRS